MKSITTKKLWGVISLTLTFFFLFILVNQSYAGQSEVENRSVGTDYFYNDLNDVSQGQGFQEISKPELVVLLASTSKQIPQPVLAPASFRNGKQVQTATINVNYIDAATTWDTVPEAKIAFQYAIDIWETLIVSNVPITVDASWTPLPSGVLGSAGTTSLRVNFSGSKPDTFYPIALANSIAHTDLNGDTSAEIRANFNSNFDRWYFGTDNATPSNQYNFATVVLHEVGHGLGFLGSMKVSSGIGRWGYGDPPRQAIYDTVTENG